MMIAPIAATDWYGAIATLQLQIDMKLPHIAATDWYEATSYCSYKLV